MKPSHMQTINDEVKRHERTVHTFPRKPVSNFYQSEEAKADAECRKVRAETRARFAQGSDAMRAAELVAMMCHGVDFIVENCGVSKDEAMLLVLGRLKVRNTPDAAPEKRAHNWSLDAVRGSGYTRTHDDKRRAATSCGDHEKARGADMRNAHDATDEFCWWRDALAGRKVAIHADHPQSGYYRLRRTKDGPWLPVAIWTVNGKQVSRVAAEAKDPHDIWTWVAKNPVKAADAKAAFTTGVWPGDDTPTIGHNQGPELQVEDQLPIDAVAAVEWLTKLGAIKTEQDANIASNKVASLRDGRKKAEAAHKTEKAPHLEAGRAVDAKYKPLIDQADHAIKRLLDAVTPYQLAEKARLDAIAKAEHDKAVAAQRAAHEAELARAKAANPTIATDGLDEILRNAIKTGMNEEPAPLVPAKVKSGGATGKAVALKTVKVATIIDYNAALLALAGHPDMKAFVQTLADRACKAGHPLAGVEFSTKQVAN